MERDKVIKLSVAGVIGVVAVILLAWQFLGGGPPKEADDATPPPPPAERGGGGRALPGSD